MLTIFSRIYNWDIIKNLLDFGDLDLSFMVTGVGKLKIHGGGTFVFSENLLRVFRSSTRKHML